MSRPSLKHSENVQKRLRALDETRALAFVALCVERQFRVYVKAAEGKAWSRTRELRAFLDSVWNWLEGAGERPPTAADGIPINEEEIEDDADSAATEVAISVYGLAGCIETGELEGCLSVCENGLTLLQSFLFERLGLDVTPKNEMIVDEHELMQREFKIQLDDLEALRDANAESLPITLEALRSAQSIRSILGSYWFNL